MFSLTESVAFAEHTNATAETPVAQMAQDTMFTPPKKQKKGAGIVRQVEQLMNTFWREWQALDLWSEGPPEDEEMRGALTLINGVLSQIKALTPTTEKEKKAVARATKDLNREGKNLNEQLFRATKMDPLREATQDIHQMDEDWREPSTIAAKLTAFEKIASAWAGLEAEAAQYSRGLAREVRDERKNTADTIRNLKENLANAQENTKREQERNHEFIKQQHEPSPAVSQPTPVSAPPASTGIPQQNLSGAIYYTLGANVQDSLQNQDQNQEPRSKKMKSRPQKEKKEKLEKGRRGRSEQKRKEHSFQNRSEKSDDEGEGSKRKSEMDKEKSEKGRSKQQREKHSPNQSGKSEERGRRSSQP